MTDQTNKPVLDQQTFEKLLQAAYVLQEHNRKMRELEESLESQSEQLREQELANQSLPHKSKPESDELSRPNGDYTLTLAQIVEAQHQIQMRHLESDKALAVVAERVARITGAAGAAIGILDGTVVRYRAGAGPSALPAGTEVPLRTAVCQANIRTGQVIRSENVNTEILFDSEPCLRRGILSLVAVPIYHDGDIVGALELYFDRINGFAEQDIHTCQLMAGLVTEAIGRDAESDLKTSTVAERPTILAAIEELKPDLAVLAMDQAALAANPRVSANSEPAAEFPCWKCGNNLVAEEQFCGKCGAPRASSGEPSGMQSKIAPAWQEQQTSQDNFPASPADETMPFERFPSPKLEEPELMEREPLPAPSFAASTSEDATAPWSFQTPVSEDNPEPNVEALSTVLVKPRQEDIVWSSAMKARDFLESLTTTRRSGVLAHFWHSRRGDFYLAVAIILVVVVIRWGIWSNPSVGATGRGTAPYGSTNRVKPPAPDADLSAFDKFLIALGLAEAPDPPQYKGNPSTQVWVDLHTALYYCPGSDLYGKTPRGKLSSQRAAQLDQFEPANRKACD